MVRWGGACLGLYLFGAHFIEIVVVSEGGTVDATCPPSQLLKLLFDEYKKAAFVFHFTFQMLPWQATIFLS